MPRKKGGQFDQTAYVVQYMKENIKHVKISLNKTKAEDRELIDWLDSQPGGASGYMKDLIRADIERKKRIRCQIGSQGEKIKPETVEK